jgi:hypothetical protein
VRTGRTASRAPTARCSRRWPPSPTSRISASWTCWAPGRALARREALLGRFARFIDHTRERAVATTTPPRLVGQAIVGGIHELVYSQLVRGEAQRLPQLTGELLHYTFMLLGVPRALR